MSKKDEQHAIIKLRKAFEELPHYGTWYGQVSKELKFGGTNDGEYVRLSDVLKVLDTLSKNTPK